jgi:hypothetical protein
VSRRYEYKPLKNQKRQTRNSKIKAQKKPCSPTFRYTNSTTQAPMLVSLNCPVHPSEVPKDHLTILLPIRILRHKPTNPKRIHNRIRGIPERERCLTARLGIILRLQLIEALAIGEIIFQRDVRRQIGAGIQRARALAAVEVRHRRVFVDPVGAGCGAVEAGRDAVAGAVDAVFGVEVDFGNDAGHVDALVVADAARFAPGDDEVGESVGRDDVFADCAFTLVGVSCGLCCFGRAVGGKGREKGRKEKGEGDVLTIVGQNP